jgi:hypothetical protein
VFDDPIGLKTDNKISPAHTFCEQRRELSVQQRLSPDFDQALGSAVRVRRLQAPALAGRQNDCAHLLCLSGLVRLTF